MISYESSRRFRTKETFHLSFTVALSLHDFVRKNAVLFFRTKWYGFARNRTMSCDIARLLRCENDVKLQMACTVDREKFAQNGSILFKRLHVASQVYMCRICVNLEREGATLLILIYF